MTRGAPWAVVALLGLLLVAGCSSGTTSRSSPSSAASRATSSSPSPITAPAPPAAPKRGSCYELDYTQAVAPTDDQAATGCGAQHTSQTYLVGRLQSVLDGHLVAVDSTTVQDEVADTCPKRLAAYLGATPDQLRLSLLRSVWFTPSVTESDAGATWYRCDVVAVSGDQQLAGLTGDLKNVLATASTRATYAMCATDRPGEADFQRVLCSEPHTWRAIQTVDLSAVADTQGRFPGLAAVKQGDEVNGEHVCAGAARSLAADALDYQWGYEWPTAEQWRTGQTYGRCWAPDSGGQSGG